MKPRRNIKSDENRLAAASLLADLDEEFSTNEKAAANKVIHQIDHSHSSQELDFSPLAEREQYVSNTLAASRKTVSNTLANREQIRSETVSKTEPTTPLPLAYTLAVPLAEREQTVSNTLANGSFDSLVGKERELIVFIFERCQIIGSLQSPFLSTEELRDRLKVSSTRVRNLVHRLVSKGFLEVCGLKKGRASQRQFVVTKDLFQQIHLGRTVSNTLANRELSVSKPLAYPLAKALAAPSSSSRGLNFKESTTTQPVDNFSQIFEIDVTNVQAHGITHSVISRCVELYPVLKPEQLEILVARFAEFMKAPKNKVQNARGFFISLAEQASKGQVPLDHIETPDERLMREFVKQSQEQLAQRDNLEKQAQAFEFEIWLESLGREEKLALVPESSILKLGALPHTAMLRQLFTEKIWPDRREQILGGGSRRTVTPVAQP